jgi:DNA processing protein
MKGQMHDRRLQPHDDDHKALSAMACPTCLRRSALLAALAPAISRLAPHRHALLELLSLPDEQLLHTATQFEDRNGVAHNASVSLSPQTPRPTERVPTALCRHDAGYPRALAQLPSAPAVLYATRPPERLRELLSRPTVAILGSRDYSPYARQIAFELARDLARAGVTVLSGLNEGLEGIAHHGALHAHGRTIAVVAGAPDRATRIRHDHLHRRILAHGVAISELPPGFTPRRGCAWPFVASQRIAAALADPIVLLEAAGRSCALLAVEIAADLGAEIAVLPGRVTDPGGKLLLGLLRDGAHPIGDARDVLELIHGARVEARGVAA